jgi:hypothetical protein
MFIKWYYAIHSTKINCIQLIISYIIFLDNQNYCTFIGLRCIEGLKSYNSLIKKVSSFEFGLVSTLECNLGMFSLFLGEIMLEKCILDG